MNKLHCVMLIDDHYPTNVLHKIEIESTERVEHIITFTSPSEAYNYLLSPQAKTYIKPNIIFLDINMPGMNGWEFIKKYKQIDNNLKSDIVILMLSTSTHPKDLENAEKEPEVGGYIYKPLAAEEMMEVINSYLDNYK